MTSAALVDAKLIICCGAGGVGKTSSSAALAMHQAQQGRRVVVMTIDPARRLAQALGVGLDNEPTPVPLEQGAGRLHALMLDPKTTFDKMVTSTLQTEALRHALLNNHIYRVLTQTFAGMQEMMAVERLFELLQDERFDLVVLDTPPTTNVLQFFESPERMARFFDRRVIKWLLPSQEPGRLRRLFSVQSAAMLLIAKIAGESLAQDLQQFFASMGDVSDALSTRAGQLRDLLSQQSTRYVVVTGPEQSRIDETLAIINQLHTRHFTPAAVIVNRVTPARLTGAPTEAGTGVLARLAAQRDALSQRASIERHQIERLRARLGSMLISVVPRLDVSLDSVAGLHVLARALA